jgi:hypothetical protein
MGKASDNYLIRFNRLLVWLTLILFVAFILFGYGILNPRVVGELTGGLLTLLLIHILIGGRTALIRWGVKQGKLLDAFLILLGVFAVTLFAVMQYSI